MNATRFSMPRVLAAVTMVLAALSLLSQTAAAALPAPDAVFTWSHPAPIASGLTNPADPVLAYTPDGVRHAVWQADGSLYYAAQKPGQGWSATRRVTAGTSPAVAVDGTGQLHVVYTNSFQQNWEIYHIRLLANGSWSFARPVSHTTGPSVQPVLIADNKTGLHAAWMDHIGPSWTIYMGTWKGDAWSSYPVLNAVGKDPALAVLSNGTVTLAWQCLVAPIDNPTGNYEVFSTERVAKGWSVPINVSARPDELPVDATGVAAIVGPDDKVHLTWQEGERDIYYDFGRGMYWPSSVLVSRSDEVARGPQIALATDNTITLAWDEGETIRLTSAPAGSMYWPAPRVLLPPNGDQRDVTLAATASGLTVGWVQSNDGLSTIYESQRLVLTSADLPFKVHLPFVGYEAGY